MPFACLFVPDFPVQAVVRHEVELQDQPVAVLEGSAPLTKVFSANGRAKAAGVEVGMTKAEAEVCPECGVAMAVAGSRSKRTCGASRLRVDHFSACGGRLRRRR